MPEPGLNADLNPEARELADRLSDERPLPGAGFRGALGRYLAALDPGYGPRPPRLRATVLAYLGAGAVLIAVAALIALGAV